MGKGDSFEVGNNRMEKVKGDIEGWVNMIKLLHTYV
jgi:hypothetical protein